MQKQKSINDKTPVSWLQPQRAFVQVRFCSDRRRHRSRTSQRHSCFRYCPAPHTSAATIAPTIILHSPSKPASRCSWPSDLPQSYDGQHQSTSCSSAPHAVTRPPHPSVAQLRVTHSTTAPLSTAPHSSSYPLTHAPAHQVDRLQALETPQVGAKRRNVVVRHLLQRVG